MATSTVKEQLREIADELPEDATWERVRYEVYVRAEIEEGERAVAEGRTVVHEDVKSRFASG